MGTTTNYDLRFPEQADDVDVAGDLENLADDVDVALAAGQARTLIAEMAANAALGGANAWYAISLGITASDPLADGYLTLSAGKIKVLKAGVVLASAQVHFVNAGGLAVALTVTGRGRTAYARGDATLSVAQTQLVHVASVNDTIQLDGYGYNGNATIGGGSNKTQLSVVFLHEL